GLFHARSEVPAAHGASYGGRHARPICVARAGPKLPSHTRSRRAAGASTTPSTEFLEMKKTPLSLFLAGAFALAGAAHADAIFYPNGTMIDLGEHGADQIVWNQDGTIHSLGTVDTTVLGGP